MLSGVAGGGGGGPGDDDRRRLYRGSRGVIVKSFPLVFGMCFAGSRVRVLDRPVLSGRLADKSSDTRFHSSPPACLTTALTACTHNDAPKQWARSKLPDDTRTSRPVNPSRPSRVRHAEIVTRGDPIGGSLADHEATVTDYDERLTSINHVRRFRNRSPNTDFLTGFDRPFVFGTRRRMSSPRKNPDAFQSRRCTRTVYHRRIQTTVLSPEVRGV